MFAVESGHHAQPKINIFVITRYHVCLNPPRIHSPCSPRRLQPQAAARRRTRHRSARRSHRIGHQGQTARQIARWRQGGGGGGEAAVGEGPVGVQAVGRGAQLRHGPAAGRAGAQGQERLPHLQGLRQAEQDGE